MAVVVKKTEAAQFHLGNKLHGRKPAARYGVFCDGVQIGFVSRGRFGWEAFIKDSAGVLRPAAPPFSKLSEIKAWLENH